MFKKVRQRGLKSEYSPTIHEDVIYFCTDTNEIILNGQVLCCEITNEGQDGDILTYDGDTRKLKWVHLSELLPEYTEPSERDNEERDRCYTLMFANRKYSQTFLVKQSDLDDDSLVVNGQRYLPVYGYVSSKPSYMLQDTDYFPCELIIIDDELNTEECHIADGNPNYFDFDDDGDILPLSLEHPLAAHYIRFWQIGSETYPTSLADAEYFSFLGDGGAPATEVTIKGKNYYYFKFMGI